MNEPGDGPPPSPRTPATQRRSRPASKAGRRRFPPDPGPELAGHLLKGLDAKAAELGDDEALAFWGTVLDHADSRISEAG